VKRWRFGLDLYSGGINGEGVGGGELNWRPPAPNRGLAGQCGWARVGLVVGSPRSPVHHHHHGGSAASGGGNGGGGAVAPMRAIFGDAVRIGQQLGLGSAVAMSALFLPLSACVWGATNLSL
jgi:hypothetical protein